MTRDELRQAAYWRLLDHLIDSLDEKDNRAAAERHDEPMAATWRARITIAQQRAKLHGQSWPFGGAEGAKILIPANQAH